MILPDVIDLRHDERHAVARLALPHDAEVFRGHFPSMPIVSGVAQIDWVLRVASRCFPLGQPVADDFQVKFSHIIEPGTDLVLTLDFDPTLGRLNFIYRVDDRIMSSGRIKLGTAA